MNLIEHYNNEGLSVAQRKTAMRRLFDHKIEQQYVGQPALPLAGQVQGYTNLWPHSQLRYTLFEFEWSAAKSEQNIFVFNPNNYADSYWAHKTGTNIRAQIRGTDFSDLGNITISGDEKNGSARPDPQIVHDLIYVDIANRAFSYRRVGGTDGTYPAFNSQYIPPSGGAAQTWTTFGSDNERMAGNDGNESTVDSSGRLVHLMTVDAYKDNFFVGVMKTGQVLSSRIAGPSGSRYTEVYIVGDNAVPIVTFGIRDSIDYAGVAISGDHIYALIETGGNTGTFAFEFDGTEIGEILPTTPHTDTFWYTFRDGTKVPAMICKGTPGNPVTGQGDSFIQPYDFITDPETGLRSINLYAPIQAMDMLSSFSQGGIGQISAIYQNETWMVVSTGNHTYTDPYYGNKGFFMLPIDERIIPPIWDVMPIWLGFHYVDTDDFDNQVEQHMAPVIPSDDPSGMGNEMRVIVRTHNKGENNDNYALGIRIPSIPSFQEIFSDISRAPITVSTNSPDVSESITIDIGDTESDIVLPIASVSYYFWVEGSTLAATSISTEIGPTDFSTSHSFLTNDSYNVQAIITDDNGFEWYTTIEQIQVGPASSPAVSTGNCLSINRKKLLFNEKCVIF